MNEACFLAPEHGGKNDQEERRREQRLLQDETENDSGKEQASVEPDDGHWNTFDGNRC